MIVTRSKRKRKELALAAERRSRGSGFKHKPLKYPDLQIRLLNILPGEPGDSIRLQSDVFYLDGAPSYRAISYTWGGEEGPKTVYVDDEPLEVRNNCNHALWQIRLHFPGKWIWIDSICINQLDNDEKSHQVQMMFDIYRSARLVLSCVGPHADNSEMVVEAAKEILVLLLDWHQLPSLSDDSSNQSTNLENFDHLKWARARGESYFIALRKSLEEFSRRPYWSRLWIVQEMRASGSIYNRGLQVLCGRDSFERWPLRVLDLFFKLKFQEVARSLSWSSCPLPLLSSGLTATFETIHTPHLRLDDCLDAVTYLYCSDARDKLYGFLSIITWPRGFEPIKPDYSKSPWDIIQDLASALSPTSLVRAIKSLDVGISAKDFEFLARQRALIGALRPDPTWCLSDPASRLGIEQCLRRSMALKSQVPLAVVIRETQLRPVPREKFDLSVSELDGAIKTFFGIDCDTISLGSYLPIGFFSGENLVMLVDHRTRPDDLILDLWTMLLVIRRGKNNVYDVVGSAMW